MKEYKQSGTAHPLTFLLVSSTDHVSPVTGVSPTVTLSKDGAAFGSPAGAVTEIGSGWYQLAGHATDRNTLGSLLLHATATGADPVDDRFFIVPWDPYDANLSLSNLDAAVSSRSTYAGADTSGTTTLLARIPGTVQAQTGDAYAIVNSGTYGNAQLVRSTTPANTLTVDSSHRVAEVALVDTLTTYTGDTPQTGDAYARVGSPAGASVSADVAALKTDLDAGVKVSVGTAAGQINASGGKIPATIAAADVSGNPAVNAAQIGGQTAVLDANNLLKVDLEDWKGAAAPANTGDTFARVGAAGAGLTALGDTRVAHLDADVSTRSTYAGGAVASVTAPVTAGTVSDKNGYALTVTPPTALQVRQEMDSNSTKLAHLDADVSSRSDGSDTPGTGTLLTRIPGTVQPQTGDSYARLGAAGAGLTALGDARIANLDATISSRSTFAGGAVASVVAAVTVDTNNDKNGYALSVAPPTAVQVRQEMDSNSTKLDAAVSSRSTYAGADTSGTATLLSRIPGTVQPQTGDGYARIGAAGAGLTALGDARLAHLDADISSRSSYAGGPVASVTAPVTAGSVTDKNGYSLASAPPTAAQIRQELDSNSVKLDAAVSTRSTYAGGPVSSVTAPVTAGTVSDKTGYSLAAAPPTSSEIAAAVWAAAQRTLTGFGSLVADAAAAVWAVSARTLTAFGFLDKTGYSLTSAYDAAKTAAQAGDAMGLSPAPPAASDIASAVWDSSARTLTSASGEDVVLAAAQPHYAPAKAGDVMALTSAYDPAKLTGAALADALLARSVKGGANGGQTVSVALRLASGTARIKISYLSATAGQLEMFDEDGRVIFATPVTLDSHALPIVGVG